MADYNRDLVKWLADLARGWGSTPLYLDAFDANLWVVQRTALSGPPLRGSYWYTIYFNADNPTTSFYDALLFNSSQEANEVAYSWDGIIVALDRGDILRIQKYWLKKRAKELFGLPFSTPQNLLADRYEDEGMLDEATVLRIPVKRFRESKKI